MEGERVLAEVLVWGNYVRIKDGAPDRYRIMRHGIICGQRVIKDIDTSMALGEPIGSVLYLVESSDGDSIEIPQIYLEKSDYHHR